MVLMSDVENLLGNRIRFCIPVGTRPMRHPNTSVSLLRQAASEKSEELAVLRVLHSGANLRLWPILTPLGLIDPTIPAVALVGEVLGLRGALTNDVALASVRLVAIHPSLSSMHQMRQCQGVGYVRGRDLHRVDDLLFAVYSDVALHPEIPLFTLGRLMHFRVTLAAFVLRRGGCADDRSVHDRIGGFSKFRP